MTTALYHRRLNLLTVLGVKKSCIINPSLHNDMSTFAVRVQSMSDCRNGLLRKSNVLAPQDKILVITGGCSDFIWYETQFYKYLFHVSKRRTRTAKMKIAIVFNKLKPVVFDNVPSSLSIICVSNSTASWIGWSETRSEQFAKAQDKAPTVSVAQCCQLEQTSLSTHLPNPTLHGSPPNQSTNPTPQTSL